MFPKGVLPYHKKPKLYALDDKKYLLVDPAEFIFGSSAFSTEHQQFARILKRALAHAHLDFYYIRDILEWCIGKDYQSLPLKDWHMRIKLMLPFKADYNIEYASVYKTFRMLAEWWKVHKTSRIFLPGLSPA